MELGELYRNDPTYFIPQGNCPTSPLIVGKTIADLVLAKAPYKVRYAVPTMPVAGVNAPITPSGTAVIGVAEILGGYVLAKSLNPETPVAATALSSRLDMKTGEIIYISPDVFTADVAISELFKRHLNLPCSLFGTYIDAKIPGMQAVYEKVMRSLGLGLCGNLSGFQGTLNQGKVFSYTQLMLDCDTHNMVAEYTDEPVVDEESLAVEEILDIGWDSHGYLMSELTIKHMGNVWQSQIYRSSAEEEEKILARAKDKWKENLKKYEPPNHSDDFLKSLRSIVNRAEKFFS